MSHYQNLNRVFKKELFLAQKVKMETIDQDQFVYNVLEQGKKAYINNYPQNFLL